VSNNHKHQIVPPCYLRRHLRGTKFTISSGDLSDFQDWCSIFLVPNECEELISRLLEVTADPTFTGCDHPTAVTVVFATLGSDGRLCRNKGEFIDAIVEALVAHVPPSFFLSLAYNRPLCYPD